MAFVYLITFTLLVLPSHLGAESVDEPRSTIEGRLLERFGWPSLIFKMNHQDQRLPVDTALIPFLGQEVWTEGQVQENFYRVESLITRKNSLLRGRVGQGLYLKGALLKNEEGGLDFVPSHKKAREILGGARFPIAFAAGSTWSGYRLPISDVILTGIFHGKTVHVIDDALAVQVIRHRRPIEIGDAVMLTAMIGTKSHLSGATDAYVWDESMGDWLPANIRQIIVLSPGNEEVESLIDDRVPMVFAGHMAAGGRLILQGVGQHHPNQKDPNKIVIRPEYLSSELKPNIKRPKPNLQLILGSKADDCGLGLSAKSSLSTPERDQ